jgi:tetratricopeptide (TPR) repeat protein
MRITLLTFLTLLSVSLAANDKDDGSASYQLGTRLMDENTDLERAITLFQKAEKSGYNPIGVKYRLSRIHGRLANHEAALSAFEALADSGFASYSLIESTSDYHSIRDEDRFKTAASKIRAASYPCESDDRHRAFDFWLGDWRVTVNGQHAGDNSITAILGGCTLFEQWTSVNGGKGKSFNYYDPGHDHWRQIWIGDNGSIIEFTGKARDGGIYYTAETIDPASGEVTHHKFEFTQYENGDVRQFWRTSADRSSWMTIWDGRYERKQ